jgi:nucleotide-binding universal stress UspA family protein
VHAWTGGPRPAILGSVTEKLIAAGPIPVVLLRPGGRRVSDLRTLLVPLDESPDGALALGVAIGIAQTSVAQLQLLEVVVPIANYVYSAYAMDSIGEGYIDPVWDTEAQTAAQTYIDAVTGRLRERGLRASGEVRMGLSVDETIVATAKEYAADLIVMSTQALTGAARALLGSVADAVVRGADCPVLVVHPAPGQSTDQPGRCATFWQPSEEVEEKIEHGGITPHTWPPTRGQVM